MNEERIIDARGLLCPEPVLMTKRVLDKISSGSLCVFVNNFAAKENVKRLAESRGWKVSISFEGEDTVLNLKK